MLDAARVRAEYRQKRARQLIDGADAKGDAGASKPPPPKKRRTNALAGEAGKGSKSLEKGKNHPVGATIEIQPGESLKHFNRYASFLLRFSPNPSSTWDLGALSHYCVLFAFFFWMFRRVEDHMRPLVQSAMRASAATERKERKAAASASSTNTSTNKTRQLPKAPSSSIKAHGEDASPPPASATARHDDDRPKEFAKISSAAPRRLNDVAMAPPELKKLPRGAAKRSSSSEGGKAKAGAAAGVLSMAQRAMMEVERENAIRRYREMKERKAKEGDRTFLRGEGDE